MKYSRAKPEDLPIEEQPCWLICECEDFHRIKPGVDNDAPIYWCNGVLKKVVPGNNILVGSP